MSTYRVAAGVSHWASLWHKTPTMCRRIANPVEMARKPCGSRAQPAVWPPIPWSFRARGLIPSPNTRNFQVLCTDPYVLTSRDVGRVLRADVTSSDGTTTVRNSSAPSAVVAMTPRVSRNGRIYADFADDRQFFGVVSQFADGSALQQLIPRFGSIASPAASPDGRLLVLATDRVDELDLATADGATIVALPFSARGQQPVWSPEGTRFAFVTGAGSRQTIAVFDLLTGVETDLRDLGFPSVDGIDWSPDGTKIAFSYIPDAASAPQWDIAVVAADGRGPITPLTSTPENEHSPAWSPDGRSLTFTRGISAFLTAGDADLWMMNADGSGQHKLVDGDSTHVVWTSDWSPDGSKIVYAQWLDSLHGSRLFTIPAAGGSPTSVGPPDVTLAEPNWAALASYQLTVSAAGSGSGTVTSNPAGISCGRTATRRTSSRSPKQSARLVYEGNGRLCLRLELRASDNQPCIRTSEVRVARALRKELLRRDRPDALVVRAQHARSPPSDGRVTLMPLSILRCLGDGV